MDNDYIRHSKLPDMSQSIFYLFLYCLLTACTIVCSGCARDVEMSDKLRGLLNEIDSSFKYREDMIDARARNIAELRDSIRASSDYDERIRLYGRLIDEGRHFQIDSMLMYYSEAKEDALAHGGCNFWSFCSFCFLSFNISSFSVSWRFFLFVASPRKT